MIRLRTANNNIARRHSEHEIRNCLQRLNQIYKTLIKRWIFDDFDATEIRLPCCWTVFTFWNKSGGYSTQTFNSWTLRNRWKITFEFLNRIYLLISPLSPPPLIERVPLQNFVKFLDEKLFTIQHLVNFILDHRSYNTVKHFFNTSFFYSKMLEVYYVIFIIYLDFWKPSQMVNTFQQVI